MLSKQRRGVQLSTMRRACREGEATALRLHGVQQIMALPARFRLNDKQVVFERFDDEVLAINLETGTYYSLPNVSAQIWNWLLEGADLQAVKEMLVANYDGDADAIESAFTQFVDKLHQDALIVPDETVKSNAPISIAAGMAKKPFTDPVIEIYTDLQDLLLLDPIHDVDDRGWPVFTPQAAAAAKN
jgi:Coenzyme PQQ synthesis protein D (PqqD)